MKVQTRDPEAGEKPVTDLVNTFLRHRKIIGWLGVGLPIALWGGSAWLAGVPQQSSLSAYCYTLMRDVFVGILFVIGVYLLAYHGWRTRESLAGNLACIFAICVALFPTAPPPPPTPHAARKSVVHYASAVFLFATLIYFALRVFPWTVKNKEEERAGGGPLSLLTYKLCGAIMILCLLSMGAYGLALWRDATPDFVMRINASYPIIFWGETIALWAFGVSWLVYGRTLERILELNPQRVLRVAKGGSRFRGSQVAFWKSRIVNRASGQGIGVFAIPNLALQGVTWEWRWKPLRTAIAGLSRPQELDGQ